MGYPWEVLRGFTSLHLTIRYLTVLIRSPLSPTRLSSASSQLLLVWQMLQFLADLNAPLPGLSPVCPCLPCTGEPRTGHSTLGVASAVLSGGAGWTPSTFGSTLPNAAQDTVSCLCCKGTLLAHGQLLVLQVLFCKTVLHPAITPLPKVNLKLLLGIFSESTC